MKPKNIIPIFSDILRFKVTNFYSIHFIAFAILLITAPFADIYAQELRNIKIDTASVGSIKLPHNPQIEEGDVNFSDGTNSLLRITDEGNFGAIELKSGVPSTTSNKLYNDGGTLKFNGSSLGGGSGATQLNELSDAKVTGNSYFIGNGAGALQSSTTLNNLGIGENTLNFNSTGQLNTAIGNQALVTNNNGNNNTAIGFASLSNNQSGYENTAIGAQTLPNNKTGAQNIAVGYEALKLNDSGIGNIAIGRTALSSNISGGSNIGIGTGALQNNTGNYNIAIGFQANQDNQNGSRNTIIGYRAGDSDGTTTHDKSGNVFLGYQAGYNETGSDKLYIENSNSASPLIYGDFVADKVGINGKLGVGTTNPSDVLHVVGTTGQNGLRVQVGSATKLRTFSNGGTAIGLNNSGGTPDDGLYVHGNTVLNADADINGDADIGGNTIINGTTQIGTNGTPFFEIKKISGTIGNPGTNAAYLSYPTGFTKANTFLISARLDGQFFFSTWSDPVDGIKNLTVQLNNDNIYVEVEGGTILGNGDAVELVLMKMN